MDWKRRLNLEHEPTFGLDIGSSSVKLLQLQKSRGGYSVIAAALADVSTSSSFDKAQVEINTVEAIRQCLQMTGIESRLAVCGVSGPEVAVRDFKFPALAPEEIAGAVALEAGQACPFNFSESIVDYHLLSNGPEYISGVLVAATQKIVANKVHLAKNAEVQSVLMDVDGLAILNCFTELDGRVPGQTLAILNVGGSCANLAILGNDNSAFVRDIQHAGDSIIEEIANKKNLSRERVREILYLDGFSNALLGPQENFQTACHKLVADVADTLRYYTAQQKAAYIDRLYICGGFALVNGFVDFLSTQIPAKPVLWNPFNKVNCQQVGAFFLSWYLVQLVFLNGTDGGPGHGTGKLSGTRWPDNRVTQEINRLPEEVSGRHPATSRKIVVVTPR